MVDLSEDRDFSSEFVFRTSRSSGPGGQRVNKVSTRVELLFFVDASALLSVEEKKMIINRLGRRIRSDGAIHLACQESSTQAINKRIVTEYFYKLIAKALKPIKKRVHTLPPPELEEKRKKDKASLSAKKSLRRKPDVEE